MPTRLLITLAMFLTMCFGRVPARAADPVYPYLVTILPPVPGGPSWSIRPLSINNNGTIGGSCYGATGGARAAKWTANGTVATNLGILPGAQNLYSEVRCVGDSEIAVGLSGWSGGQDTHAVKFSGTGIIDLAATQPATYWTTNIFYASWINDSNIATGTMSYSTGYPSYPTDMGVFTTISRAAAVIPNTPRIDSVSVNGSGQVLGQSSGGGVCIWTGYGLDGTPHWIYNDINKQTYATALNENGEFVGKAWRSSYGSAYHAFLWRPVKHNALTGIEYDLGTLGGGYSTANALNTWSTVVGQSYTGSTWHAFIYKDGAMADLNSLIDPSLGCVLFDAAGINDKEQITGTCMVNGQSTGYLLTPSPLSPPRL